MTDPTDGTFKDSSADATSPEEEALPAPEGPTAVIDTDYEIGQDNIQGEGVIPFDVHHMVFTVSAVAIVTFTVLTLALQYFTAHAPINGEIQPSGSEVFFTGLRNWLTNSLDWFFMLAGNVFVVLCLALIVSPLGSVRLGGPHATPDFSRMGWFAMLFAAGMGIGLMFYGVSEPLSHYSAAFTGPVIENGVRIDSAPLNGAPGDALEARRLAMAATIFHWGLHPWAIYAVVALSLALFSFNKGLPLTMRSVFYPIFGEKVWGWPGHVIDILAVFATVFGLATSLGFGAEQATAGLHFLFGIGDGTSTKIILILIIIAIATISVISGVDKGVQLLSQANMMLALLLLLFVILTGPTVQILKGFFGNLGAYTRDFVPLANPFGRTDDAFREGWTAFYWAWWISWSPFVGMFIARVSRGRTVREFLLAVLIVPSFISVLWMTALGGTAISQFQAGIDQVANAALELQLFEMLSHLPMHAISSFVGIVLVVVFFITSCDSGSLVIDTICSGGKVQSPTPQRIFWCGFEGLVAIALLLGGGLTALQAMAVSTGLPFTIVLLGAVWAIIRGLIEERREIVNA
ncbi:BCCT family transporter [Paracoccus aestuariivivens]|uniref:BCCT family transporter n=1 Tax=Paracoccus aestuariivivens TaxID=1820333 RepID=A0A6L6JDD9_9RHOB|nr:BCCT family transporter [Paracoccus aestuariivivens]MTH78627.1 BCCT family transporter [Paracoccus aestuariivivens]